MIKLSKPKGQVKSLTTKKQKLYFEAISSLLFYSIQKADEPLSRELLDFYFEAFITFRKGKKGKPIEYPQEYYDSIFEANGLLCMSKRRPISYFNDSTLFSLFIDEYQGTKISPTTYTFLWKLIIQSLHYEREDFVFSYWKKAHQLFNLFLTPKDKIYNNKWEVTNQAEIDERQSEREVFLEFHYAIGGYLIYLSKYSLIEKVINWTNQSPPKYVLVPDTMTEVIEKFMYISIKGEYQNPVYFEQKYPFPQITGVDANDTIRMWIKRYIAVLFLRQYTIHSYYTYSKPLEMPQPPNGLSDKKRWNFELGILKNIITEYLVNKEILNKLKLENLSDPQWFVENEKEDPNMLIDNLMYKIEETYVKTKGEQKVDEKKVDEFKNQTKVIIKSVYEEYSDLFQSSIINEDFRSIFISGRYEIMDKTAFAENQDISYMNFDTVVAEAVAIELKNFILNCFLFMNKVIYKLNDEDLFNAIDKLEVNTNDYVIVAIGLYLDYYKQIGIDSLVEKDNKWSYHDIKIINITNSINTHVRQSLFVIKKKDLPNVLHHKLEEERINKYNLDEIDEEKHIYGNIIDLNLVEYNGIKEEVAQNSEDKDLAQKVVVCVDLKTEVRFKTNIKCVQLKKFSQFEDRGITNKLSDVKQFI